MRKNEIEKIGKTLVKDHPKLKIYFVMSCDGTFDLFGNNGYMELVHYETAFESMQASPDYELYMVLASKITEKRGFPEFEIIKDFELLIPKKSQEEIDAYYAQSDPNRRFLDTDYTPSATDFLTYNNGRIQMSKLVLFADRLCSMGEEMYHQKVYKHIETGLYYELRAKLHVDNLLQKLTAGESIFEPKLCKIDTRHVATSKAELESENFTLYESDYTSARRKASIAKLVVEL